MTEFIRPRLAGPTWKALLHELRCAVGERIVVFAYDVLPDGMAKSELGVWFLRRAAELEVKR